VSSFTTDHLRCSESCRRQATKRWLAHNFLGDGEASAIYGKPGDGKSVLQRWGIPCSEKTLAKLACVGGAPAYRRFGRIPLYAHADHDEFAQAKIGKPVRSTSEYGAP
jgi:hypothetical protein